MVIDSKCTTIVENNPTDGQVDKLYTGDASDKEFLQRVLANDEVWYNDCR